jgi:hypothetical protein
MHVAARNVIPGDVLFRWGLVISVFLPTPENYYIKLTTLLGNQLATVTFLPSDGVMILERDT